MSEHPDPLIASLVAELRPLPSLGQGRGMGLAFVALVAGMAVMLSLHGPRTDLAGGHPSGIFLLSSGLFLVLAAASAWAVVDQARPYVGVRREGWGWTALMAAVLPLSALALLVFEWLADGSLHLDDGRRCLSFGLGLGGLTVLVLVGWLRRGAPTALARAGLLTGVAAGSAGIFAVALVCPENDLVHIGLWHGMTVVLSGLLGRLAVPRLIAW